MLSRSDLNPMENSQQMCKHEKKLQKIKKKGQAQLIDIPLKVQISPICFEMLMVTMSGE
jgi:hypothetical protein